MKRNYIAPSLTVVTFKVEKGFENSSTVSSPLEFDFFTFDPNEEQNQAANYNESHWNW